MTPRDRRALMIGGAIAAAAVLGFRVVPWCTHEMRARREALAGRRMLLARVRADIRDAGRLTASAPAVEQRLVALAPRILTGRREADALADLSGRLEAAAAQQKVRLLRTTPVPDSTRVGSLRRAVIRASLEGDTRGTLALLGRLERQHAALRVTELMLTAVDPASAANKPEVLRSELIVRAWYVEGRADGAAP